jgi:hypothetical protein
VPEGSAAVAAATVHGGVAGAVVVDVVAGNVVDDVLVARFLVRAELLGLLDDEHAASVTTAKLSAAANQARRVGPMGAGIDVSCSGDRAPADGRGRVRGTRPFGA